MAQRFVSLEEAAKRLGITKERLNEIREAGGARAFRDGASWKFKEDEVQRLLDEGIATAKTEASEGSSLELEADADQDLSLTGDSGSILLTEEELEAEEPADATSSSTIIGGEKQEGDEDSDLKIEEDDALLAAGSEVSGSEVSGSEINLSEEPSDEKADVVLDASNVLSAGEGGSAVLSSEGESAGAQFEDLEELDIDLDIASSQVGLEGAPLETPPKPEPSASDSLALDMGESSIKLADDDDDVVLGEEPSSDITLAAGQSGIALADAADTGISLDEAPADLGAGSAVDLGTSSAIDLGEEGSFTLSDSMGGSAVLGDEDIVLGSGAGSSPQVAGESGSQVMAFDLEGDIDENTATILGTESALASAGDSATEAAAPMIEEEVEATGLGAVGATAPMGGAAVAPAALREAQYSAWNIAFLVLCTLLLSLAGVMMVDLLRSMWSWNEPFQLNSSLMDMLLDALP